MVSRTTSLLVLTVAAAAVTASAQRPVERAPKSDKLLKSAIARLQQPSPTRLTLAGQVLMPDGTAAAHARLFIAVGNELGTALEEIKTDPTGKFRFTVAKSGGPLPEALVLSAVVPGKAVLWHAYTMADKTLGSLTLRLTPGSTLTGKVVDAGGKALSDLDVTFPGIRPDFTAFRGAATERPNTPFTEFLPARVLKALYGTRTDAAGRFTLSGLPATGQLRLKLGANVMLAPGSSAAIVLGGREQTDVGILVAVTPGSLALHVTDRSTRKPAEGVPVIVLPRNLSAQDFSGLAGDEDANRARTGSLTSDAKGDIALARLAPGEYRILLEGMDRQVTVTEAQATRVDLEVRTGPLQGRILDTAGKPVAGVPILLEASPDPLKDLSGGFSGFDGLRGNQGVAVTDRNGMFAISPFPWEATTVTLRGAKGDAEAKWSGLARDIGKTIELRLRPGALVTVTGRLMDPASRQVKSAKVSLIRWQDSPRLTWLVNATAVTIGAQGRFKVDGLRRGEAFSIISGSPFNGTGDASGEGFESPRFVTSHGAGVQNLGDVVVHPLDSGQQIMQLYGIDSPQQFARLAALLKPATEPSISAARETLARYRSAMTVGDFDTIHRLTSHISAGWSEDRREFLAKSTLRIPMVENAQPLRFVPGISVAYLLAFSKSGASPFSFSFGSAAAELLANPDWVVFANPGTEAVRIAGIAHREQGEWKVVGTSAPFGNSLDGLFLLDSTGGSAAPRAAGFSRSAPSPEAAQRDAALAAGEKYLAAWSHGDEATQLALTSPLSSSAAATVSALRKAKSRRLDEGICPVSDMMALRLSPIQGLTQWESEWLAGYARTVEELSGQQRAASRADADNRKAFPGTYVERGDLIPFTYNADGHDFLILMVRHSGSWQVLEPAVPL